MNRKEFIQEAILRAPGVPDWFSCQKAATHELRPKLKSWMEIEDEEQRIVVKSWTNDPCFDLPEELSWFASQVKIDNEWQCMEHQHQEMNRLIMWRLYFANELWRTIICQLTV